MRNEERGAVAAGPASELDSLVASWARARAERQRIGDEHAVSAHLLHADVHAVTVADAVVVLEARGVLDAFSAPALAVELERAEQGVRLLVLDLADATLVDSSGLGAILGASIRLRARGARLVIVAGRSEVMRGFELTGLHRVLEIVATRERALAG